MKGSQDLREALSRLLRTNAAALVVLNGELPIGLLTLADISATTQNASSAAGTAATALGARVFREECRVS